VEPRRNSGKRTRISLDDDFGGTTVVQVHRLDDIPRGLLVRDEPPVAPALDAEVRLPVWVTRGRVYGELTGHAWDPVLRGARRRLGLHYRRLAVEPRSGVVTPTRGV